MTTSNDGSPSAPGRGGRKGGRPRPKHAGFLDSEVDNAAPESSVFHVIPAPWERSVSYGAGAGGGPAAILEASRQLEVFDGAGVPAALGIHTAAPVDCRGRPEVVVARIEAAVAAALEAGSVPVVLGGEHTVSLGAFKALLAAGAGHNRAGRGLGRGVGIVQIDAHADLRESYENDPLSHACVMRRAAELGLPIVQIGVRSLSPREVEYRTAHAWRSGEPPRIAWLDGVEAASGGRAGGPVMRLALPPGFPELVYLTIDVDGLDPSVIPDTGTPEPGGLGWYQTMELIRSVASRGRRILGFDVVELAPTKGRRQSPFAAARLVYNVMGIIAAGLPSRVRGQGLPGASAPPPAARKRRKPRGPQGR